MDAGHNHIKKYAGVGPCSKHDHTMQDAGAWPFSEHDSTSEGTGEGADPRNEHVHTEDCAGVEPVAR